VLAIWTQACVAYHPAPSNTRLTEWRQVRVSSAEPFAVKVATSASTLVTACRATEVEGRVRRMAGDTLVLATTGDVAMAPEPDGLPRSCPRTNDVTIVLTPAMDLEAEEVDGERTTGFVIGLSLAAVSFVLYRVSHASPPPVSLRW
jgi:hypothetical protein